MDGQVLGRGRARRERTQHGGGGGRGAFADCGRFGLVPTKTRGEAEVLMETGAAANSSRDCGSWVASRSERNSSGGSVPIMATFNGSEEAVSLKGFDGSICRCGLEPFVFRFRTTRKLLKVPTTAPI